MTADDITEISVCVDCVMGWANADFTGISDPARVVAARGIPEGAHVVIGDDEQGFSWSACDACESPLGGDRFQAFILA